jgi:DNA repair protein RecN (Recombination protein N)
MSLKSISLRDFVIVRELELDLSGGFTVLTGETGAGKSILIDALQLALGARADAGVVREGAARCEISAEFDSPKPAGPWLEEAGFDGGDTCCLRRTHRQPGQKPRLDQRQRGNRHASSRRSPTSWWTSTASMPGKA